MSDLNEATLSSIHVNNATAISLVDPSYSEPSVVCPLSPPIAANDLDGKSEDLDGKSEDLDGKSADLDGKAADLDGKSEDLDGKTEDLDDKAADLDGKAVDPTQDSSSDQDEDQYVWEYLDAHSEAHGPFTMREMKSWILSGYFSPYLYIRKRGETQYGLLEERREYSTTWKQYCMKVAEYVTASEWANPMMREYTATIDPSTSQHILHQQQYQPSQYLYQQYAHQSRDGAKANEQDEWTAPLIPKPVVQKTIEEEIAEEYAQTAKFNTRTGRFQSLTSQQHWQQKGVPIHRDERQLHHYFDFQTWREQRKAQAEKFSSVAKKQK